MIRFSGNWGGRGFGGILGGCSRIVLGRCKKLLCIKIVGSSARARSIGTLAGWYDLRGGVGCLVTEMHEMPPSRPRGCVQANYQQMIPNLQSTFCIVQKLHKWSKKVLRQRFWLNLCTEQMVSARACTYQICPTPITLQVLNYLASTLCRQIPA